MAATEASAVPVVQEDAETKVMAAEQPEKNTTNSETATSEVVDKDSTAVNSQVVDNKETVNNDTDAAGAEEAGAGGEGAANEEAAPPQSLENTSSVESKTSFLDSFLNKSGLGKVMGGRKKKEQGTAGGGGGGDDNAVESEREKEGEKGGDEAAGAEGGAEGEAAIEKPLENGEKEEDKKVEKGKQAEAKSTVRDLIRKPVARIFSHRSTDKKEAAAAEPQPVTVRSKSLDRLEDPDTLNATADSTIEEGAAGGEAGGEAEGGTEGEQKALSSKHIKRWHSFKKLMAQKTHKKSGGGGEEGKEEGAEGGEEGGRDSSTLDSKESGQKRWKLKRSWTFQGLKRDPSMVGISGKAKSSDKDSSDNLKPEEAVGGTAGEEEAKAEGEAEEAKTEGGEEEKAGGGEEEKGATAGGGTVTQHANEIWTSFKKRVIHKSKRSNTECAASGEEDATAVPASGEEATEEGKDGKSAKGKRSHFGRAVSLKNFIMRKGKSSSVELGEGAKEEEEEGGGGQEGGADGEATAATEENNDKAAATGETPAVESGEAVAKKEAEEVPEEAPKEVEKTPAEAPVTNGENGCSNGTVEDNATHNHQEEEKMTGSSPVKKSKEAGGGKEEANSKIINATPAVNSDKKAGNV